MRIKMKTQGWIKLRGCSVTTWREVWFWVGDGCRGDWAKSSLKVNAHLWGLRNSSLISTISVWPCAGHAGVGTDHDKLLAQLETELKESQQIVRLQQQLLQVWFSSHINFYKCHIRIVSSVSVCRIVLNHLSPLNWLIPIFWKSGNVFRCRA